MKNTQASKKLLEAALQNLPVNRHTADVRTHIYHAIDEIERVEKKHRHKAQEAANLTPAEKWKLDLQTSQLSRPMLTPNQKLDMVSKIDEMISAEKQKIEQIKQQNQKATSNDTLLG